MGYSQEYKEEYTGHYLFAEDGTETVPDGITASLVKLDNFTDNHPWYEYDEETKEYKRFQFGKEHVDQLDNEPLTLRQYHPSVFILPGLRWKRLSEY